MLTRLKLTDPLTILYVGTFSDKLTINPDPNQLLSVSNKSGEGIDSLLSTIYEKLIVLRSREKER